MGKGNYKKWYDNNLEHARKKKREGMRSMALCLGFSSHSTYQRYEDGTAKVPASVARAAVALEAFERDCDAARAQETNALLQGEFPRGIPSEF